MPWRLPGGIRFPCHGLGRLADNTSVWFNCVLRGDNDVITLAENTQIQDGSVLHTDAGIGLSLGRGVSVGHLAMLHGCTVGDGSPIGRSYLIGSNTLIPEGKVVPDGVLVLGSPGRIVRELKPDEIAEINATTAHYVPRLKHFRETLRPQA